MTARCVFALVLACCLIQAARAAPADAAPASSSVKEAGKHFQRGVTLYNEADYRAALVEFRRAYEIAPNAAVLYNLGQTYYQLQNYAQAMLTLERYLAESAGNAPHRAEVEQTLETLRTRVGKIKIALNLPDCEITVDDELVGKTPLSEPVVVSIGRRKVTAIHDGHAPETRFVDVAAGDTVAITLTLADPKAAPAAGAGSGITKRDLVTPGWIVTASLGGLAVASGAYAYLSSRSLDDARKTFPANAADLDSKATRVSRFALAADILGVAALVTGAITWKLSRSTASEVRVGFAHNAVQLTGSF